MKANELDHAMMYSSSRDKTQYDGNTNDVDSNFIEDNNLVSMSFASTTFEKPEVAAAEEERQRLGRTETRLVRILRILTLLILVLTAGFVVMAVYTFGRKSRQMSFSSEFEAHAIRIIESFHTGIGRQLSACDTLSASITSYAIESGSVFPNVTVPHWGVMSNNFQIQAQATFVQFYPLVTGNETDDWNRTLWQKYAALNHIWLMPSFTKEDLMRTAQDLQFGYEATPLTSEGVEGTEDSYGNELGHLAHAGSFSPFIWSSRENGPSLPLSGPYLPAWHFAPTLPIIELLNLNAIGRLIFYEGPASVVIKTGMASLGSGRKVTGVLLSGLYWRVLFQDLLPPSAQGIIVVLKNSLGQAETYRIDGSDAFYVRQGDLHDAAYDDMVEFASIVDYLTNRASPLTQSYTAANLTNAYTEYQMFVYPSSVTEAVYVTNEPMWYAVGIGSVSLFVAAVFLMYNYLVERRQKLVLDRAVQSIAVVHSLFPENVQKRLYEEQGQYKQNKNKDNRIEKIWNVTEPKANDGSISNFLESTKGNEETQDYRSDTQPIADLFSASTVFFADLAGFTRWSSSRSPVEVFGLLETIYSKFDSLALRRGVFKVETIGDCYVAVTGVPEVQEDHALIMAKFGSECMVGLQQLLVGTLTDKYGEDTRDLSLRIGIHSGPVTAGVLRGVKARFQLFGDTVNTAARMESTGMPGRIHCLQATADLLVAAGKGGWIRAREGLVHAKGKGELQTYWIENAQKSRTARSLQRNEL